ncbi:MAG: mechanosensitive ion channel family protein [Planctomycetota bacterium]|nr:mechanosensitive ion channel family protein [Planctomycetota bacterium]
MRFLKQLVFCVSLLGMFTFPDVARAQEPTDLKLNLNSTLELHEAWAEGFKEFFPESLHTTHFLLADYQWIGCLALIFFGFLADLSVRNLLTIIVRWIRRDQKEADTPDDQKRERKVWKPVGLLTQAVVWYWGAFCLGLPLSLLLIVTVALKFFTVVASVWTAFRFIDWIATVITRKAAGTETKFDDLLIPLVRKALKAFSICVGLVLFADVFQLDVTALIGGLGIGGAALAFASQDTLSNLFGSLTVLADRPFEIGDWIVSDGVEGTVENVGMRSTRVRTFYNSVIVLPNSRLTTAVVDNMGKREFRRFTTKLGVQYDTTPEQLEAFCEAIREIIRRHPYTRKDYFQVYVNDLAASSIDILLYMFFECTDWPTELRERHRLLTDIMRVAHRLGVQFAFPTQTLHLFQEENHIDYATLRFDSPHDHGLDAASAVTGHLVKEDFPPVTVISDGKRLGAAEADG